MLIKFMQGARAGQTQHVQRSPEVQLLLDSGLIEEVRTPGPQVEDHGIPLNGTQHIIPPCVETVMWGIKPLPYSQDGKPTIVKQFLSEFTWYAAPPKACPTAVAEQFKAALALWEKQQKANDEVRRMTSGNKPVFI